MMKTRAVRIYGVNDLRLEEFDLPEIKDDEILARVVSDSICMSSHKLAIQGAAHKRVRYDLTRRPCIIGHEFCGVLEKIGDNKYLADYNGVKCSAIFNPFVGAYYVDDKYGIVRDRKPADRGAR